MCYIDFDLTRRTLNSFQLKGMYTLCAPPLLFSMIIADGFQIYLPNKSVKKAGPCH